MMMTKQIFIKSNYIKTGLLAAVNSLRYVIIIKGLNGHSCSEAATLNIH